MEEEKKENKWRYRLQLLSERHNRIVFSFSMPVWLTAILAVLLGFVVAFFALFVVTSTPLQKYLPGYLDVNKRAVVVDSAMRLDSLERENDLRSLYLENLQSILLDTKVSTDSIVKFDSAVVRFTDTLMVASEREAAFNAYYEDQERFGLNAIASNKQLSAISFITPVKAKVLVPEEEEDVDLLAGTRVILAKELPILSPLEATVVVTRYLIGEGNEVTLQCPNDYVIVLSHLSSLMVSEGQNLKAGAVLGHSGTEKDAEDRWISIRIWHKGSPVDPLTVMQFEK